VRLGDPERERIFEALSRHAAAGHLELPELERRVALVARAQRVEQARAVLADLPALEPAAPAPPATDRRRPAFGRGHGDAQRAHSDWTPTSERFRDPRTQRVMRVWEDAQGGRHYVAEDG
jgi:hypothetical protein